jgi:hypothetical protein
MRKYMLYGIRSVSDVDALDGGGKSRPHLEWNKKVKKDGLRVGLPSEDLLDRSRWWDGARSFLSLEGKC